MGAGRTSNDLPWYAAILVIEWYMNLVAPPGAVVSVSCSTTKGGCPVPACAAPPNPPPAAPNGEAAGAAPKGDAAAGAAPNPPAAGAPTPS